MTGIHGSEFSIETWKKNSINHSSCCSAIIVSRKSFDLFFLFCFSFDFVIEFFHFFHFFSFRCLCLCVCVCMNEIIVWYKKWSIDIRIFNFFFLVCSLTFCNNWIVIKWKYKKFIIVIITITTTTTKKTELFFIADHNHKIGC